MATVSVATSASHEAARLSHSWPPRAGWCEANDGDAARSTSRAATSVTLPPTLALLELPAICRPRTAPPHRAPPEDPSAGRPEGTLFRACAAATKSRGADTERPGRR